MSLDISDTGASAASLPHDAFVSSMPQVYLYHFRTMQLELDVYLNTSGAGVRAASLPHEQHPQMYHLRNIMNSIPQVEHYPF